MAGENTAGWTELYVTSGECSLGKIEFKTTDDDGWSSESWLTIGKKKSMTNFIPKQIIQREDSKTTILIWEDDSKTMVQCSPDEEFIPEFGVAMATINKIYGSRNQFKKYITKKTFWQDKQKKKKEQQPNDESQIEGLDRETIARLAKKFDTL